MLQSIVAATSRNEPLVLIRSLGDDARQALISDDDIYGDTNDLPAEVMECGRVALGRDGARIAETGGESFLIQTLSPQPQLIIVGAVHIAQALIPMARVAGYDIILIDPRVAFATPERFPGVQIITEWPADAMSDLTLNRRTAVVTLSHDAKIDEPALKAALESDAFYIGALGSRKNHAGRLERLAASGFDSETLGRIAGPIGLHLGGRSPAEIAVSILAQIIQSRYRQ
jgi:xanthine dehydrogenase accessory factor